MADDQRDEDDELEQLKALMETNQEALEKLRTMLQNLEVLLRAQPGSLDERPPDGRQRAS